MKIRTYIRTCVTSALFLAMAIPAAAQQPSRPVTGGDERTILVAGGLTFMNLADSTGIGVAGNALFNTLKSNSTGNFGIVADFGLNHFDGGTVVNFSGGGRFTFNTKGKVVPYGQFLVGLTHCCGDSSFDPALGFGLDYAWKDNMNFRAELQFYFSDFSDPTRFFFGVSMPINKKK